MKRIPVKSLADLPFLEVAHDVAPALHDKAKEIAAEAGVQFNAILPANNVLMSLNEIAAGLGFSLLPDYVCQILPANVVARPLECDSEPDLPLLAAYRIDEKLPYIARFVALFAEQLADHDPMPLMDTAGR
jgi:LysR family hca operon transcriptional activator